MSRTTMGMRRRGAAKGVCKESVTTGGSAPLAEIPFTAETNHSRVISLPRTLPSPHSAHVFPLRRFHGLEVKHTNPIHSVGPFSS